MKTLSKIAIIACLAFVTGCAHRPVVSKPVPVAVPLLYSPAPLKNERPALPHLNITPEDDKIPGKVVQSYAASVQALIGYAKELEKQLEYYGEVNSAYAALRAQLIADWKQRTGIDITIADPPQPGRPTSGSNPTPP